MVWFNAIFDPITSIPSQWLQFLFLIWQKNTKVTREDALKFASRHAMLHIETSAKTSDGVQCVFEKMVQMVIPWQYYS